jgi:hypothetical protein
MLERIGADACSGVPFNNRQMAPIFLACQRGGEGHSEARLGERRTERRRLRGGPPGLITLVVEETSNDF